MIKAIIFDCFGVLTTDKWKEFVSTLPNEQREPAREINHAWDSGRITEAEFIKRIKALTGRNPGEVEVLLEGETEFTKNSELLTYIASFRPKYKIGLLSNIASNWVRDSFLTGQEQKLFDQMIFSFEAGMTKPNPQIFELAAERLGVQPGECVFVDDIERYCQAAREVGMQAILYKDFDQTRRELENILKGY